MNINPDPSASWRNIIASEAGFATVNAHRSFDHLNSHEFSSIARGVRPGARAVQRHMQAVKKLSVFTISRRRPRSLVLERQPKQNPIKHRIGKVEDSERQECAGPRLNEDQP